MITDELTVMTREDFIPGVQRHLFTESPMVNMLLRFSKTKSGVAGNGVRITDETAGAGGGFYSGFDTHAYQYNEGMRARFALWVNDMGDIVVAGTYIEENLGTTTAKLLEASSSLATMPEGDAMTIVSHLAEQNEKAGEKLANDIVRTFWGITDPSDKVSRLPQSSAKLMDETSEWDGVAPSGLGVFPTNTPWGQAATIPGQSSTNIHEPRVFSSAVLRTISKAVLGSAVTKMTGRGAVGYYLCPLYPDLFDTLSSEWDAQVQIPMGVGEISFQVAAVVLRNCIYFADAWAPTNEARHFHVGLPNGNNGTYYYRFWRSPGAATMPADARTLGVPTPKLPMTLGRDFTVPIWADPYTRDTGRADSLVSALRDKFTPICTHRWRQFVVRDLQA